MDRRRFNVLLLKATPAALLGPRPIPHRSAAEPQWDHARYVDAIVIDSLCAPVIDLEAGPSADTLTAVRQSGITAVNFSISVPDGEETLYNLANVQNLVDDHPEAFQIVRRHSDIARCKQEGKLGIMLGFQYPTALEKDLARIETYRKLGVRIMQLTYNSGGKFGGGCLDRLDVPASLPMVALRLQR
jgi:membrane dipeptidase